MRGRITKDISQTDIAWLHDIADKSEPKVRAAFIAAIKGVQERVDDTATTFGSSAPVMEIIDFIRADAGRPLCLPEREV